MFLYNVLVLSKTARKNNSYNNMNNGITNFNRAGPEQCVIEESVAVAGITNPDQLRVPFTCSVVNKVFG